MRYLRYTTDKQLRKRLRLAAKCALSAEEIFEQKVSFVYSAMDTMSKNEVREALQESAQQWDAI